MKLAGKKRIISKASKKGLTMVRIITKKNTGERTELLEE